VKAAGRALLALSFCTSFAGAQTHPFTVTADGVRSEIRLRSSGTTGGRVTFLADSLPIGTAAVHADGTASFSTSVLASGIHRFSALEWGTGRLLGATTFTIRSGNLGGLSPVRPFLSGISPVLMAAGDLTGTGDTDVVLAGEGQLAILHSAGDGTLGAPVVFKGVNAPVGIAVADFDGSGRGEIVALGGDGRLVLRRNGALSETALGGHASGLAVADFNGDGISDLAVSRPDDNSVEILLGNGDGSFRPGASVMVGITPRAIVAADFNRDGIADLATANAGSSDVTVLLGDGMGGFRAAGRYWVGGGPSP